MLLIEKIVGRACWCGVFYRKRPIPGAAAIMNLFRSAILLTVMTVSLAVPASHRPAYGQDADMTVVSPQGLPPYRLRYNVADEWEVHRRAASPNYRPAYRSIFVDPGYTCYCPLQPHWNGVFSAGGQPHPRACCR